MSTDELYAYVVNTMSRWSEKGEKTLSTGVRLICRIPHDAPDAWFHVHYPLTKSGAILKTENELGGPLPPDFRDFLLCANGIKMFAYHLSVWGIRKDMART